jgi:wobble nucleotide-excising tRNase
MARPKGSTNKPKTASDAQMLHKSTTRTRPMEQPKVVPQAKILKKPTHVVCREEDIAKVNKMLSSFEPQSLGEEIKMPIEKEKKEPKKLSSESLNDVLKKMKEEIERGLTPEQKIASLEHEVKQLHKAIEKFNVVIDYLETKLGIEE